MYRCNLPYALEPIGNFYSQFSHVFWIFGKVLWNEWHVIKFMPSLKFVEKVTDRYLSINTLTGLSIGVNKPFITNLTLTSTLY